MQGIQLVSEEDANLLAQRLEVLSSFKVLHTGERERERERMHSSNSGAGAITNVFRTVGDNAGISH